MYNSQARPARWSCTRLGLLVLAAVLCMHSRAARATSVIPISDAELYRRADLVLHGVVLSSEVAEDRLGRPETVSVIRPLATLKGGVSGDLVIHQLGGTLPDGRFVKMWGAPEYKPGREVVVFAIARPGGDYETAEMLLGKFEVSQDEAGNRYAVPELASGVKPGIDVYADAEAAAAGMTGASASRHVSAKVSDVSTVEEASALRPLPAFLSALRRGNFTGFRAVAAPAGRLTPVEHPEKITLGKLPQWGSINNVLYRYTNNATAAWTFSGTANITGGGTAEANGALAMWTNDPYSSINYTAGAGASSVIYLDAVTSNLGCGWSTCLAGGGVIGCGGPRGGGGGNVWRGDTYSTIGGGTVELRSLCTTNLYGSATIQSVLEHELGHTLGLGHSDQNVSAHDTCRGDEGAAIMRSLAQSGSTMGTDDQDAIRWLYGDGGNSCSGPAGPAISSIFPASGITAGGTSLTILGAGFQSGATVTLGGAPLAAVTIVNSTTIYATTASHAAGSVSFVVTNPDSQTGSRPFSYVPALANGADMDANGQTDLIWRNQSNGMNSIWLMNGTSAASVASLAAVTDPAWKLVGAGDFNADGKADLVWRNDSTGLNSIWLMNGTAVSSVVPLITVADTNWKIVGVGDFNGDGKADLVWRNVVNGLNSVWLMNGTTFSSIAGLPTVTDTNWKIVGVGNMDGLGGPELVWRNPTNGLTSVWFMNGTAFSSIAGLPTVTDPNWTVAGVGDFNGDGKADLIWRNTANGLNAIWLMNGGTATAVVSLPNPLRHELESRGASLIVPAPGARRRRCAGGFCFFSEVVDMKNSRISAGLRRSLGLSAACILLGTATAGAQIVNQPPVALRRLTNGLANATTIAQMGDSRLFVTLQTGRIVIWDGTRVLATPFLDVTALVAFSSEQGLLGLAFHPQYATNGWFFVNYTNTAGSTVVARYHVSSNPNVADSTSGVILLTIPQPFANHNGGNLRFGPDGYLYIGMGDGGSGRRSELLRAAGRQPAREAAADRRRPEHGHLSVLRDPADQPVRRDR